MDAEQLKEYLEKTSNRLKRARAIKTDLKLYFPQLSIKNPSLAQEFL